MPPSKPNTTKHRTSSSSSSSKTRVTSKDDGSTSVPPGKVQLSFTNWMLGGSLVSTAGSQTSLRRRMKDAQGRKREIVVESAGGEEQDEEEEVELVLVKKRRKKRANSENKAIEEKKPEEEKPNDEAPKKDAEPEHTCGKKKTVSEVKPAEEKAAEKKEPEKAVVEATKKAESTDDGCRCCPKHKNGETSKPKEVEKPAEKPVEKEKAKEKAPEPAKEPAKAPEKAPEKEVELEITPPPWDTAAEVCTKDKEKEKDKAEVAPAPWDTSATSTKEKEKEAEKPAWDAAPVAEKIDPVVETWGEVCTKDKDKAKATPWDVWVAEEDAKKNASNDKSKKDESKKKDDSSTTSSSKAKETTTKGNEKWTAEKDAKLKGLKATNTSWKQIAKEMSESEGELKNRWKTISSDASKADNSSGKGNGNEGNQKGKGKKREQEKEPEKEKEPEPEKTNGWGDGDASGVGNEWGGGDAAAASDWNSGDQENTTEEANKPNETAGWDAGGDSNNITEEASGWDAPGTNNNDTSDANAGKEGEAAATSNDWVTGTGDDTWGNTDTATPWMSGANGDGNDNPEVTSNDWGTTNDVFEVKDSGMSWGAAQKAAKGGSGKYFVSSMGNGNVNGGKKTASNSGSAKPASNSGSAKSAGKPNTTVPISDAFASYWDSQNTSEPQAAPVIPPTNTQPQFQGTLKLQRSEIWTDEDCNILEELMRRHKEHVWLNMQAGFFNWTGRMITAEMIEKKFKDDGA